MKISNLNEQYMMTYFIIYIIMIKQRIHKTLNKDKNLHSRKPQFRKKCKNFILINVIDF